jgi:hypothetical protein
VAELADAYGSGPYGETRGGSSPLASSKLPFPAPVAGAERGTEPQLVLRYLEPAAFLLAAQRAFISWESLLRPAGVSRLPLNAGAALPPAARLLAAQRAFISWESLLRPAAVSPTFFRAGAVVAPPFILAQRAFAAAESFARVAGEK